MNRYLNALTPDQKRLAVSVLTLYRKEALLYSLPSQVKVAVVILKVLAEQERKSRKS